MFGRRPTARRTCEPTATGGPSRQSTDTATPSSCRARPMHVALVRTVMPSPSKMLRTSAETSSSSRAIRRGAISTIGDVRAEAAEHLPELEADVAPADDHQVARHMVQGEDGRVRQVGHVVDARHVGHVGAAADVDEDARRRQPLVVDPHDVRCFEPGMALEDGAARSCSAASARRRCGRWPTPRLRAPSLSACRSASCRP